MTQNFEHPPALGFTGHEHLDRTGFIHMNGRVYDPTLGRFLSPDPVVQAPTHSQSWNRYSYVLNNPLSNTDPSGYQFAPIPVSYQPTTTGYEVTSLIDAFAYSSVSISWGGSGGFRSAAFESIYKRDNITVYVFSLFTSFGGGGGTGGIDGGGGYGGPTISYSLTIVMVFSTESIVDDAYQVHVAKDRAMPVGVQTGQENNKDKAQGKKPVSASSKGKDVIIEYSDGSKEIRSGGTRAWRNNNPGNIRNTGFSKRHGSLGEAGGFAVFPDEEVGRQAIVDLLKTDTYQKLTINEAINRYAPSVENNTKNYQTLIQYFTGLDGSAKLNTLDDQQLKGVAGAIGRVEGWREGKVTNQ